MISCKNKKKNTPVFIYAFVFILFFSILFINIKFIFIFIPPTISRASFNEIIACNTAYKSTRNRLKNNFNQQFDPVSMALFCIVFTVFESTSLMHKNPMLSLILGKGTTSAELYCLCDRLIVSTSSNHFIIHSINNCSLQPFSQDFDHLCCVH